MLKSWMKKREEKQRQELNRKLQEAQSQLIDDLRATYDTALKPRRLGQ